MKNIILFGNRIKFDSAEARHKAAENITYTLKGFASFLGCIGIALVVMYYFNGTVGILIITALISAFILSLAATLAVMRSIKIEARLGKTSVTKGESSDCILLVSKNIIIPAPLIDIVIECSPQLTKEIDICRVSLAGNERNIIKIPITAKYSGATDVTVSDVILNDFLGIFRFSLKKTNKITSMKLDVYPNIPDVPVQTELLKTTARFSSNDDDDEETNETANGQTGMPGYDHREYFPGDPIKRINWKLSSKRDIYMIRLDEKIAGAGQVFLLDSPPLPENDLNLTIRDNVIEGMLAVFTMLIREGREIIFFFAEKGNWQRFDIHVTADIYALQEKLSCLESCGTKVTLPAELTSLGKTPICFTAATSDYPESAASIAAEIPDVLIISSAASGLPKLTSELWNITNEFEIKKSG